MPRVGVRLRQRQAQNPVSPANTTSPRDTSGSRNWHLHRSAHTERYESSQSRHHSYRDLHLPFFHMAEELTLIRDNVHFNITFWSQWMHYIQNPTTSLNFNMWVHLLDLTYKCASCPLRCYGFLVLYILEWTAEVEWSFDIPAPSWCLNNVVNIV